MICGIGLDIVDHDRFERLWKRHQNRFLARVFRPEEIKEGLAENRKIVSWAVRFAAKEAVFKSLHYDGLMRWQEISILRTHTGLPRVILSGHLARYADQMGQWHIHLSLTHSRQTSAAVAVLESAVSGL